jgi:imidazolonepropionase-like amidohydrolase
MFTPTQRLLRLAYLGCAVGLLAFSFAFAEAPSPERSPTLALVGARILTQTDAGAITGTVLIHDGKIVAVGPAVAAPSDATRIDVTGFVITPGLIDARSTLWLQAAAAKESAGDAGLDVLDGIDPNDEDWKEVIRQGVTTVYVQPANSGIFGGRGAVLRVGPAETVEEIVVKASAAAQAALGTAVASAPAGQTAFAGFGRRGGGPPLPDPVQPPLSPTAINNSVIRYSHYVTLKQAFDAVKQYDSEWKKYDEPAKSAAGEKPPTPPARMKRDATKEFLRKVLKGELPLRLEAHRDDDVRNALRLADEYHLKVVLEGLSDPGFAAESLAKHQVRMVLGPFVEFEDVPIYRKDRPADWPKTVLTPDTRWALGTFSGQPRGSRLLRVHAAAAVARGIDPDRVLRAMTRDAAEILGVGDRLGVIAEGKQADLVVFAGNPTDPSVPVRLVVSGGKVLVDNKVQSAPEPGSATAVRLPNKLPKKYTLRTRRFLTEDGKYQPATVLIENGRIGGFDTALKISDDVPTFDLGTAVLTPGLVAGHSQLGLEALIDDPAEADAGQVRAIDAFDPQHRAVRELVAGGFTSALFAPGSVNVVAGSATGVRLGTAAPHLGGAGVKFVLTANSRGVARATPAADSTTDDPIVNAFRGRMRSGPQRYPGSLAGQVELIEQVLSGKSPESELYLPTRVRQQIQTERHLHVAAVLEQKEVAFFEAHTRAEVSAALQLIDRFKLRGVLVGPEEIKPFVNELKRLNVGMIAAPTHVADYDPQVQELGEAAAAGVPVAFGSAPAQEMRIAAAMAVNAGMSREAAWRGLTTTAARLSGMPSQAGRIVVGAPADFAIWGGSPLDVRSRPLCVVVDGKVVSSIP